MGFYAFNTDLFGLHFLPSTKRTTNMYSWVKVLLSGLQWSRNRTLGEFIDGFTGTQIFNYDAARAYSVGELVYYDGIIYECIAASTGNLPTNVTYFAVKSFSIGELIRYLDKSVYACVVTNTNGIAPANSDFWIKTQTNFIGINELARCNSQILAFEYILNKWFDTSFNYPSAVNDIYITNTLGDYNTFLVGTNEAQSSAVVSVEGEADTAITSGYSSTITYYTINIPLAVYDALNPSEASGTTTTKDAIASAFIDKYNLAGLTYLINPY